jgi:Mrp family chromosome partitioning ATPase
MLDARGSQFGSESRGTQGVSLTTMAALVGLEGVSGRAIDHLPGHPNAEALTSSVVASADEETGILTITANASTRKAAERRAVAFAKALQDYMRDQRNTELRVQMRSLERQLAALPSTSGGRGGNDSIRLSLQAQVSSLRIQLAAPLGIPILERTSAEAIGSVGITPPESQGARLLVGALAGLLGGILLALVLERFDRRITTWRSSEELLEVPLLAEIPQIKRNRRARRLAVIDRPTSRAADAFRLLASSTLHAVQEQWDADHRTNGNGHGTDPPTPVVAVTSAVRSEGKSLVSANLAAAFGELGYRTLLISLDLRSPTVHRYFGLAQHPGIVDAAFSWDGRPGFHRIRQTTTRAPNVSVIPSGSPTARPAAILAQNEIDSIFKYGKEEAQLIILDTPAILLSGDALPLIQDADSVLLVARLGKTSVDAADRVSEALDRLGANVIGYALNSSRGVIRGWRQAPYGKAKEPMVSIPDLASTRRPGG